MPLDDFTAYRVNRLAYRMRGAANHALEPLGLTIKHFGALLILDEQGSLTQRQLGDELGIDRTTMVAFVDDLENARYVVRSRNEDDRRAYVIELSRQGTSALKQAREALEQVERELLSALTGAERRAFGDLLSRVAGGSDRPDAIREGGSSWSLASQAPLGPACAVHALTRPDGDQSRSRAERPRLAVGGITSYAVL